MSWSQNKEEEYILQACPEPKGRFLDFGAYEPFGLSNTRALFERGWGGVLIEPSPSPFERLKATYGNEPRITLIQAAVGLWAGELKMWITSDGLSTSEPSIFRKWSAYLVKAGLPYAPEQVTVPAITLEMVYAEHGPFDFVSIDTEGTSVDLFRRLIDLGHRPKCICVEHDSRLEETKSIAARGGYRKTYYSGENEVYVR